MAPYKGYTDIGLLEKESIADVVHVFPKAQKRKEKEKNTTVHMSNILHHFILLFKWFKWQFNGI